MKRQRIFSRIRFFVMVLATVFLAGCAEEPKPGDEPAVEETPKAAEPVSPPTEPDPEPAEAAEPEPSPPSEPTEAEEPEPPKASANALLNPSAMNKKAPESFIVNFDTSKGTVKVQVTRAWSPRGADRFFNLAQNGFFDECRFFRIVPDFVVQFGMHGDPKINGVWTDANIKDDPVTQSNRRGTIVFATAGPNTRTTQLFINTARKGNGFLDGQGFSPFGRVIEGMSIVDGLYDSYGEKPDQGMIANSGNEYLKRLFPKLDYIKTATAKSSP